MFLDYIRALDFSKDGKLLVAGSDDLKVTVIDVSLMKVVKVLDSGHSSNKPMIVDRILS